MILEIILIPIIAGLIGWLTNYLAIQLLFYPIKPKRILFFKFQGIIPKKKDAIVKRIAHSVEKHFITHDDIEGLINNPENKKKLIDAILNYFKKVVKDKIPIMLQGQVLLIMSNYIKSHKEKIADEIIGEIVKGTKEISLADKIEEKLKKLSTRELNKIIIKTMRAELKHIEIMGAVVGFLIGIFQVVLIIVL